MLVDGDFGLWVEQLLAESTGKHGKGLVPVYVGDTPDVQTHEVRLPDPHELGRSSSAGSSRPRSRGRSWRSIRSISPTSRRRRTRRAKCSREARTRRSTRTAMWTSCSEAQAQATTCSCRRSSIRRGRARSRACATDSWRRRGSVRLGSRPRYLHSTGQLHKGGPNTGIFVQVVDDLGEELPIPGKDFGFRRLIAAQAAGDYEALKERGRRVARIRL